MRGHREVCPGSRKELHKPLAMLGSNGSVMTHHISSLAAVISAKALRSASSGVRSIASPLRNILFRSLTRLGPSLRNLEMARTLRERSVSCASSRAYPRRDRCR